MISYNELEASELFDMLAQQKLLLVDVRSDDEVAKGIIPGATHISLALLPVQFESLNGDPGSGFLLSQRVALSAGRSLRCQQRPR